MSNIQPYNNEMNLAPQQNTGNQAVGISSRELAKVQGEIFMAKQYPRNIRDVERKVEVACRSKGLAEEAMYTYARGKTNITGASIRLAETLARLCTNIKYGYEEVEQSQTQTVVRAYAYDIESNVQAERTFTVPHIRYTKKYGNTKLEDPRDIYETVANSASRRIRACILEVLPPDLVRKAIDECTKTLSREEKLTDQTRQSLLNAFSQFGITKEMIEHRIQRNFEAITANQVVDLRRVYSSIVDGIGNPEDYFDTSIQKKQTINTAPQQKAPTIQQSVPQDNFSDIDFEESGI